jgi:hypothetical protein
MRSRISENEFLKKAFQEVYFTKERDEPEEGWQFQVMRRVRHDGSLKPATGFWPSFEHLVWRLAPVCCLLVIVLGVLVVNMDLGRGDDYLGTVTADMEKPTLSELYGLEG